MREPIRMLAIDMDGTLLRDDNTISAHTHRVLERARERGVHVVVATGRMFSSAKQLAAELGLGNVPIITYSGGLIATAETEEILYHKPLAADLAREVLAAARETGVFTQMYIGDTLYVPERNSFVRDYEAHCRVRAQDAGEEFWRMTAAPTKILLVEGDLATMERVAARMHSLFEGRVNFVQSTPYFFEMVAADVSKGIAVEQLGLRYGVPLAQVMAFGNAQNDAGMLQAVGWPVAVGNAIEPLKRLARLIAPTNNEDGVAKTVEKYVLAEDTAEVAHGE